MKLDVLTTLLETRLQHPLPGAHAHEQMRAVPLGDTSLKFEHTNPPRQSAVLILLYDDNGVIRFPLIKRPDYVGMHGGQVSLPGGKTEPGETMYETALRECEEEIGVDRTTVRILGALSEFFVVPSNFIITPVVGMLQNAPVFKPDPYEVVNVLQADMDYLLRADAILQKEIQVAGRFRLNAPHFLVENEIVWGATAMILNEFCVVIREVM